MDRLAQDILMRGLLDAQGQEDESARFQGIMKRFAELLPQKLGVEEACKSAVQVLVEETNFTNCSIMLWDGNEQALRLVSGFGLENLLRREPRSPFNRSLTFQRDEGVAGRVFDTGRPVFIEDSAQESVPRKAGSIVHPGSLACLPLMDHGVLNISSQYPSQFPPHLKRSWELVGEIVGYLVLQGRLREEPVETVKCLPPQTPRRILGPVAGDTYFSKPSDCLSDQVLDYTPQGICVLDPEGRVLRVNRSVRRLHGEKVAEVIGRAPSVFFRDPSVLEALFEKARTAGQAELTDVPLVSPGGDMYLGDVHLARMADDRGNVNGYLLVLSDMTKKKEFAEKILRSEKLAALGTMAGGVAHDFNNLLMAILGNIQMIMHLSSDEEMQRRLQSIEKAVHDGAHTVRRLQKLTDRERAQNGSPLATDVTEAIRDVVELTRPRWKNAMEKYGHTVKLEMTTDPNCHAAVHASDLREVLTNLIFNAIEAMPEGGTLTLSSRSSKEWTIVEVADNGIGMSEEVSRRIFDPFYTTKGLGNSGLGLSVSWSLVSRGGGEIQVRSKPGKGTTFTLSLPKAACVVRAVDFGAAARGNVSRRLLVVDDDLEVLGLLRDMLRLKGHRVVATHDGEKAMDLIATESFDLVLTDLGMPVVSGWDIAMCVKKRSRTTPVILITGWGAQYEEEDLSKHGIDSVLSKPLSWEKLLGTVEKYIVPSNICPTSD